MYLEYSRNQQSGYKGSLPSCSDSSPSNSPCSTFAFLLSLAWLLTTNKGDGERDGVVIGKGDGFRAVRFLSLARRCSDLSETFIVLEAGITLELDQGIRQYMHVFNNTIYVFTGLHVCLVL
jgi:hypothetical protein